MKKGIMARMGLGVVTLALLSSVDAVARHLTFNNNAPYDIVVNVEFVGRAVQRVFYSGNRCRGWWGNVGPGGNATHQTGCDNVIDTITVTIHEPGEHKTLVYRRQDRGSQTYTLNVVDDGANYQLSSSNGGVSGKIAAHARVAEDVKRAQEQQKQREQQIAQEKKDREAELERARQESAQAAAKKEAALAEQRDFDIFHTLVIRAEQGSVTPEEARQIDAMAQKGSTGSLAPQYQALLERMKSKGVSVGQTAR